MNTHRKSAGFTLLEILITLVILAFGLLGLVNLQTKLHMTEMEAYQRTQAVGLLQDMVNRIQANGTLAVNYVTPAPLSAPSTTPLGTNNSTDACAAPATTAARDRCAWSNALKGAAETDGGGNVGAMIGARGCVEQVQAALAASCRPAIYRISVAWQGLHETAAPGAGLTCGANQYGSETLRRVIATTVAIGTPKCLPPT